MEAEIFEIGRETINRFMAKELQQTIAGSPAKKSAAVEEDDHRYRGGGNRDSAPVLCVSDLQAAYD